jgi:hypothetical protein
MVVKTVGVIAKSLESVIGVELRVFVAEKEL